METISVSQINKIIADKVGELGKFLVEGEINEWKIYRGKVIYFTLKDEKSTLSCQTVIFKVNNWRELEEGMKVRALVEPKYNQTRGQLISFAHEMLPVGEGALKIALEKLKQRLKSEGLFDLQRKKDLPRFPQKIGLITSRESEAIKDFKKIISESYSQLKIYHYDVRVEGETAKEDLLEAFQFFNTFKDKLDAIVLTRGGGSLESLRSFNEEEVVRAVASSRYPVIVGVGHEGDVSLAELAADKRASTPTNCAEILVENWNKLPEKLDLNRRKIINSYRSQINEAKSGVDSCLSIIKHSLSLELKNNQHCLSDTLNIIKQRINKVVESSRVLADRFELIDQKIVSKLEAVSERIDRYLSLLNSQNPRNLLKMGYSIVKNSQEEVIKSVGSVKIEEEIKIVVSDGNINSQVKDISNE
jgi:exodeoxyribonuclease VII large subunit